MTGTASPAGVGTFDVGPDLPAAMDPEFEGVNACRAAALAPILGRRAEVLDDIRDEVELLGLPNELVVGPGLDEVTLAAGDGEQRQRYWEELSTDRSTAAAFGFLLHLLASRQPREATSAAATLWQTFMRGEGEPWMEPDLSVIFSRGESGTGRGADREWAETFQQRYDFLRAETDAARAALVMAGMQLRRGFASPDDVVRELAGAALMEETEDAPVDMSSVEQNGTTDVAERVSVLVHGTRAWKGDWWRPRDRRFHAYVAGPLGRRPYAGGAQFSWSGRLSRPDRAIAAVDLIEWASDRAPAGLWSAFAHSYGGDVVAQAMNNPSCPLALDEVVLLSVPVNDAVRQAVKTGTRIVDVRLSFDMVLTIAKCHQRVKQRLPNASNVTEVILRKNRRQWHWSHSATHEEAVWVAENIQALGGF